MTFFDVIITVLPVITLGVGIICLFIWLIWQGVKAARLKPEDPKFTQLLAEIRATRQTPWDWRESIKKAFWPSIIDEASARKAAREAAGLAAFVSAIFTVCAIYGFFSYSLGSLLQVALASM